MAETGVGAPAEVPYTTPEGAVAVYHAPSVLSAPAKGSWAQGTVAGSCVVVGDSVVGEAVVGETVVGETVIGLTVVGDTVVGDPVMVVGDTVLVVGDTVVGLRVKGDRVAGLVVVGLTVFVADVSRRQNTTMASTATMPLASAQEMTSWRLDGAAPW